MAQTLPNVIWVLTDQQRAMMLSCNGDPNVHTPNIDALADMGVNFTRAVSGYPLCCPFRGSMLTSRYPHECVPGHEYQMPPEMPTIADVFNENGYHTAYFGKWHLDGFHEREGRAALHTVPPEPPHDPYLAPPEYMARFNPQTLRMRENVPHIPALEERARREYAGACAMVENMDWNMGRIRNKLWETGLAENTHILFFSDHGDMHGSHGMFLKTHPYEESLRIPFVIGGASHYTGVTRARVDYPINHVDIAPTTLGLCGIRPPEWMQGTDYSAARLGGTVQNAPDSAYIQKNVETPTGYGTQFPWRGIVTRDGWKYVCLAGTPYLMFNLNEDPLEQHNMALNSFFSAKRRELNERLRRWVEETGDDFPLPKL